MAVKQQSPQVRDSTLHHVVTSVLYTVISVVALGIVYPVVIWGIGTVLFHHQAEGSLVTDSTGKVIGSALVGQNWSKPRYFQGRPSAAGKGYDAAASSGSISSRTSAA